MYSLIFKYESLLKLFACFVFRCFICFSSSYFSFVFMFFIISNLVFYNYFFVLMPFYCVVVFYYFIFGAFVFFNCHLSFCFLWRLLLLPTLFAIYKYVLKFAVFYSRLLVGGCYNDSFCISPNNSLLEANKRSCK